MLYNGNLPCTGTASETGNCQSLFNARTPYPNEYKKRKIFFQLKEIGHLGVYGVHAQLHVIQVKDPGPEVTQVVNPVLAAQQLLEIASVSGLIFSPTAIMVILVLKLFVSVEGTWNA